LRPAVVWAEAGRGDWILRQITSKSYGDEKAISLDAPDFVRGSLRSYVRPGKTFHRAQQPHCKSGWRIAAGQILNGPRCSCADDSKRLKTDHIRNRFSLPYWESKLELESGIGLPDVVRRLVTAYGLEASITCPGQLPFERSKSKV